MDSVKLVEVKLVEVKLVEMGSVLKETKGFARGIEVGPTPRGG
jgi:hypothetical protein